MKPLAKSIAGMNPITKIGTEIRALRSRTKKSAKSEVSESAPPTIDRRREVAEFYDHYEGHIETLCDAAQYGPEPYLEEAYRKSRQQLQRDYRCLKQDLQPYLAPHTENDQRAVDADVMESLFHAPTLGEFLRCDDGFMIQRILLTRDALTRYAQDLRTAKAYTA